MQRIKKKELIQNIGLMLASVLVCAVLFELGCRVLNLQPLLTYPAGFYTNQDKVGYQIAPNVDGFVISEDGVKTKVKTDSLGFWEEAEPPFRHPVILVLGDSLTFGAYGCNQSENYPKVVQRRLEEGGKNVTVINAGVPGYGPVNEVEFLKKYYDLVKPEKVVLTFYVGNDVEGATTPYIYKVVNGELVNVQTNSQLENGSAWQKFKYDLWRFRYYNLASYRVLADFMQTRVFKANSPVYAHLVWYTKDAGKTHAADFEAAKKQLLAYKEFCDGKGIECMVYVIPERLQMLKDNAEIAKQYGITNDMDYFWIQDGLDKFFGENNITYYDLTQDYMKQDDISSFYLPINGHWNRKGCDFVGSRLAARIADYEDNGKWPS